MRLLLILAVSCLLGVANLPVALAQDANLKELSNDFIRVTQVRDGIKKNQEFAREGEKVELKDVEYKEVKIVAELKRKPDATLANMLKQSEKDPNLRICLTPYDAAGKPRDEICQGLIFSQLASGNVGGTVFTLPVETSRYTLRVIKRQASGDSGFKIEVGSVPK